MKGSVKRGKGRKPITKSKGYKRKPKVTRVYSINFFFYFKQYDSYYFTWFYNNVPEYLIKRKERGKLYQAFLYSIRKLHNTVTYNESEYYAYYKIFRIKRFTKEKLNATSKGFSIYNFNLQKDEDVEEYLAKYRLNAAYRRKFGRRLHKASVDSYELFRFFLRNIVKKFKLRRIKGSWKAEDYKFSTLKR